MIHLDWHTDTQPPFGGTSYHAGAAFRIGVEEGLIDPWRTLQIGLQGPLASLDIENWSREHFTVITLDDILEHGIDWLAAETFASSARGRPISAWTSMSSIRRTRPGLPIPRLAA